MHTHVHCDDIFKVILRLKRSDSEFCLIVLIVLVVHTVWVYLILFINWYWHLWTYLWTCRPTIDNKFKYNALFVNRSETINRRRGWSSSGVTQPSTIATIGEFVFASVCVGLLLCLVFNIAVHLGNFASSPPSLQVTVTWTHRPFDVLVCLRL